MQKLAVAAVSRNYFNMPLWVAYHAGFFGKEGLDVSITLIEGIDEVTQRLKSGEFNLTLGVTENVILDCEHGGRLRVIGGNVNRLPFSFIARPHIRGFEDLRGGRIGVSSVKAGSSSLVMKLLEAHGLRYPDDYTLLAVGPILSRWKMLQSGEIDAGLQGAPLNHIAVDAGFFDLGSPRAVFPDFQFTSLDVDIDWAEENRKMVIAFLRAFVCAHAWFYANKQGTIGIAQKETGVDAHYAAKAWDEYTRDEIFPRDGRASVAAIQTLINVSSLIRDLPVRSRTDAADYIDSSFIDAAEKSLAAAPA